MKFTWDKFYDLPMALVLWSCASPILAILMIWVRIFIGSPVFFTQWRPGRYGKPFKIFKLRSMTEERDFTGNLLDDDLRLTKFGAFLRNTSLDELPELFNVIKGDMSLVGPRPLLMEYLDRYTPEQTRRHDIKPGITGWAQINGRNAITWKEKFALDVWYVENRSFRLDLEILAKTLIQILRREGISQPGHVTSEKFNPSGNPQRPDGVKTTNLDIPHEQEKAFRQLETS